MTLTQHYFLAPTAITEGVVAETGEGVTNWLSENWWVVALVLVVVVIIMANNSKPTQTESPKADESKPTDSQKTQPFSLVDKEAVDVFFEKYPITNGTNFKAPDNR